ncbi:MAG: hypothetical protein Q8P59_12825, partial [Dehalococcoidia bacterium]|nr:hypothetical protein [Dehalococcoidia bacterium]
MLLTGLVQVRLLTGVDLVAAAATRGLVSEPLDALSSALSILFSGELSLFYALIASLLLWRRGLGRWSYAPLLF